MIDTRVPPESFNPELKSQDPLVSYWLRQVSLRLRREVCWSWKERGALPGSSHELPPFADRASAVFDMVRYQEEKSRFFGEDAAARHLTGQIEMSPPPRGTEPEAGSFGWVAKELGLEESACFVLALGLSVAFDSSVGTVIAACLNDPAQTRPTLALAQRLWDEPEEILRFGDATHALFRLGLLRRDPRGYAGGEGLDWDAVLSVPALAARQLLIPTAGLPSALKPVEVSVTPGSAGTEQHSGLARRLLATQAPRLRVVPLSGGAGSPYRKQVEGLASATRRRVLEYQGDPALLSRASFLNSLLTLCWLKQSDLFVGLEQSSAWVASEPAPEKPMQTIPVTLYWAMPSGSKITPALGEASLLPEVSVPRLTFQGRKTAWRLALGPNAGVSEELLSEVARRFRFEEETIQTLGRALRLSRGGAVSEGELLQACRAELKLEMAGLAQELTPRFSDEELVLPAKQAAQVEEIYCSMTALTRVHYAWGMGEAWNECGISVLLAGPPGTGKTMAAEVLARRLNLPIYRVDLSQVVNKYIGETEKNLKRIFDAADVSDSILFFDEADAIFGKRTEVKDAHDRYANLEVSYLLERMERFKGLAILATNRKKDLDEAFLRRLRYVVEFPIPDVEYRKRIWRQVLPRGVDCSAIDLDFLARQIAVSGGHIRSIALNASLQCAARDRSGKAAALRMEDVVVAAKREFDKLNRPVAYSFWGPYAELVGRLEA